MVGEGTDEPFRVNSYDGEGSAAVQPFEELGQGEATEQVERWADGSVPNGPV
ncbi:MAG: hypothetical protein ACI9YT_001356 [Halobacteriales archaeon]|jgi:hypothetical protein